TRAGPTSAVSLDDGPVVRLPEGDVKLPIMVSWRSAGGAVGDVIVRAGTPSLAPGWSIAATAVISEGPDTPAAAAFTLNVRQVFSQAGKPDIVATTQLVLSGDGTYQRQDGWLPAAA